MIPTLRQDFNARWTPDKYRDFLRRLEAGCGFPIPFRNCETPCFFTRELADKLARYGQELTAQLLGNPAYLRAADATIPAAYRVPNEDAKPLFLQADFGLDMAGEPKMVEIQGFPSLYAYQPFLAECYRDAYGIDPVLPTTLGGASMEDYREIVRQAIVGDHDPANVVLLEVEPEKQKTLCDFILTERMFGARAVCLSQIFKRGRRLFYERDGVETPIARLYNRVIVDELQRRPDFIPGFDFRDELDVEWAGHPNWYYKVSKFSLPWFDHVSVPRTYFLNEVETLPATLEDWVLKPLFSFAGLGVRVGPTQEEIAAIEDRSQYILQERIDFAAPIATPHGPTKAEIRVMYIQRDAELVPLTLLVRMGRGKMMGVDQNRDLEWVGASAGFLS